MNQPYTLSFLAQRFVLRCLAFIRHWYKDGSCRFLESWSSVAGSLEQLIAVRITLKNFFKPLYQDYSIIGRIIGPVFRLIRVLFGLLVHAIVIILFFAVYLVWLCIPVGLVAYILYELF